MTNDDDDAIETAVAIPERDKPWLFREGNAAAVKHGARSERIVLARAKDEYERLVTEHPQLEDFADETQSYAVSLSVWSLYLEAIDRIGVMDETDEPRASLSKQLRLWGSKCVEHRQRLGLNPTSSARLWLDRATADQRRQEMLDAHAIRYAEFQAMQEKADRKDGDASS